MTGGGIYWCDLHFAVWDGRSAGSVYQTCPDPSHGEDRDNQADAKFTFLLWFKCRMLNPTKSSLKHSAPPTNPTSIETVSRGEREDPEPQCDHADLAGTSRRLSAQQRCAEDSRL